jgi:propanol-preferring alcohol dehydrogenase
MQAFRLVGWQEPPEVQEVAVPTPGPDQVLVEVAAVGLCHTDIHFLHAAPGDFPYPLPFTLGHEIAGRIAAVGSSGARVAVGDMVAVALGPRCWRCLNCLRGEDNNCTSRTNGRGWGQDGGLAGFVAVPALEVVRLTSLDPVLAAPLTDAGVTAYHAVRRVASKLRGASTTIVIGVGGLGGFAVQYLRQLTSSRIVAIDASPPKLERARSLGADLVLDVRDASSAALRELTHGLGAEAVLDFVGVDATMQLALATARQGGSVAIVGAGGGRAPIGWGLVPVNCDVFVPMGGTTADLHDVIALAEAGRLQIDVEPFGFDQVAEGYRRVEDGTVAGRAVVTMG